MFQQCTGKAWNKNLKNSQLPSKQTADYILKTLAVWQIASCVDPGRFFADSKIRLTNQNPKIFKIEKSSQNSDF